MGRTSQSNPRYRTKSELCADIAFVLNSSLHYGTKYAVFDNAMWVWTEFEGKYKGCEYWSVAAQGFREDQRMLVHEHAVPKKLLIDLLLSLSSPTPDSVQQMFQNYCKAAVITKAEDAALNRLGLRSKMPSDWDGRDPWARYKAAGIVLRSQVGERCNTGT